MNANKALWEKGDFTTIAATMRESGAAFVADLSIAPGMKVLDLGCGDGNTAIPAAERGAEVLGVDIASNLVRAGQRRAKERNLAQCRFEEGNAAQLDGVKSASFDLVVSVFGAMFAPRPTEVAREMARVARPGGRIVMGNWIPGDPTLVAQILKISAAYSPPPPEGFVSPMRWGVEADVIERFGAAGIGADKISFSKERWMFDFPGAPAAFLDVFRRFYGPTMNAFEAAAAQNRDGELLRELDALFTRQNIATEPGRTQIPANYLRVTVAV